MKFYWYNNENIRIYLRHKLKNPDAYEHKMGDVRYRKLYKINKLFSSRPWGMIHDITDHVPNPMNIQTNVAYKFVPTGDSFDKVALDAAGKIANSTDRKIAVTWSGGIDSTAALVALLQTVPMSRLTIVCNQNSIDEFPNFYYEVIEKNIETITHNNWFEKALSFFNVSGDAGDTVWGALDNSFWSGQSQNFNSPWQGWLNQDIIDIDFVEEFCSWSGTKINTVLDLRVWFYLCCKWQDKAMRFYFNRPGLTLNTAVPFYNLDNSFQNWTMNNLESIIGPQWTDYKIPAKKFINNFFKDDNYFLNKTKFESTSMHWSTNLWTVKNNGACFALDTNYHNHVLPSWPLLDAVQIEDWNDQYHLIPSNILQKQ
jgi:hypothetical protein